MKEIKQVSDLYIQEILDHYHFTAFQIIYDSDVDGFNKKNCYTKILNKHNLCFIIEIESQDLIGFITSTCIYFEDWIENNSPLFIIHNDQLIFEDETCSTSIKFSKTSDYFFGIHSFCGLLMNSDCSISLVFWEKHKILNQHPNCLYFFQNQMDKISRIIVCVVE